MKILKFLAEMAILLVAGFLMLYLTYYFGWTMLPKGMSFGNDIPSALNNVYYLERWYPPIPHWIHLWSGGMPFLQLYPILPFVTTFFIHKFWAFSIYKAMKLVMFFSIPLAAMGVVALGRVLTKNWWVGILAGILMILSPDSWLWITFGGFFALSFSVPLFAWTLVFFSLALEKENFWLSILAALFYGITWLFHPTAAMLLTVTMGILGFGFGVKLYGWKGSWRGLLRTMAIGLLGLTLFAWWIFPFLSREEVGGIGLGAEQMYKVTIRELLGLDLPLDIVYITSTFFTASAVILFILGSIIVFIRRSILRWAVITCGLALFIMTAPYYAQPIVEKFVLFWSVTNVRSGLILRILGPIIGAYGAVSLMRPVFWLLERFLKVLKGKSWWFYLTETIGAAVGFIVFIILLRTVIITPPFQGEGDRKLAYSGYGPLRNWVVIREIDGKPMALVSYGDLPQAEPLFKEPKTILSELPHIVSLTSGEATSFYEEKVRIIIKKTGVTEKQRIDTTPMGGTFIGMLNNFTQVGQVQGYIGTSLIQKMIGWQIDCVYYNELCGPQQIADLYRWFGVSQVWFGVGDLTTIPENYPKFNDSSLFEPEAVYLGYFDAKDSYMNIYHFKNETGLASISNKPAILVIGDNPPNNDVFDIVFRGLTKADFGYKDAWSIKGKRFIDDYSLEELKKFEAIILHGYRYHNYQKAWNLLEKYVQGGGNLLVDTGWQYFAQDWGAEEKGKSLELEMPKILPVKKTIWEKIEGEKWNFSLSKYQITEGVTLEDWGEPIWSGKPWGVASSQRQDLRDGAVSLLENDGKVLTAAWEVGRGKVVWTGFDFWGHLVSYKANDERKLVQNIFKWLLKGDYQEVKLDFQRLRPDFISINFNKVSGKNKLLFKEVASNNWKSTLESANGKKKELAIYKAGPGWKMVFLPNESSNGQMVFSYRRNKVEKTGFAISALAIVLILGLAVSKITKRDWDLKVLAKIKNSFQKKAQMVKSSWEKEDEQ